jgi:hypothetical protein
VSAAFDLGSEASAAQAAGETGNAGTPGRASVDAETLKTLALKWREKANESDRDRASIVAYSIAARDLEAAIAVREPQDGCDCGESPCARPQAAPGLAAVLADRHELSALNAWQGTEISRLSEQLGKARATSGELAQENIRLAAQNRMHCDLLDEIGVLAANAPEDGDSFAVLEDIAMRIAAHGVPEEGK